MLSGSETVSSFHTQLTVNKTKYFWLFSPTQLFTLQVEAEMIYPYTSMVALQYLLQELIYHKVVGGKRCLFLKYCYR